MEASKTGSPPVVDILIVTWNTLPWLKLLVSQVRRFMPEVESRIFVWDNASKDGTSEWLLGEGIRHHVDPIGRSHADSLSGLIAMSDSPYIAFLDVDAFPIRHRWLDEAVELLKDESVGAVGIGADLALKHHRPFIHPSFCVFRRELYTKLKVTPHIVHDYSIGAAFDVGEVMCARFQDEGYVIISLGKNNLDLAWSDRWENKVVHCGSSTPVLSENRVDRDFLKMVDTVVEWHRRLLSLLGLWGEFKWYATESASLNPHCTRYLKV